MAGLKRFKKFEKAVMVVASAAALTTVLMSLEFNLLEASLYDFRMVRGSQPKADPNIVLVALDDQTSRSMDDFAPLPLDLHTRFMEALESYHPKAVGYLVDLNRVNQLNPELFSSEWGKRFVDSANRLEARGIPVLMGTPFDVTGEVLPPYPLSMLPHSVAVIHKDGNVFSEDKITRRALTHLYDKPVFHVELAQRAGLLPDSREDGAPRGSFYVPEIDGTYFFFRYHGSTAYA
jgi:CHASE2 domain-containing sensor protein